MSELYEEIFNETKNTPVVQWVKTGRVYSYAGETVEKLPPGYYKVINVRDVVRFIKTEVEFKGLLSLHSKNIKEILSDIKSFWKKEDVYDKYNLPYKRGILLSGSPGTGKTSLIKIIIKEVIKLGGIAITFDQYPDLKEGLFILSEIQPDIPVIVTMEDIDNWNISTEFLNILDGITQQRKVIFIATTNYPEELDEALINRPGRIDAHYIIGTPSKNIRRQYIKYILEKDELNKIDIEKYVEDTKGFPIGHIKELIVSTVILEKNYNETLEMIRNLHEGKEDEDVD